MIHPAELRLSTRAKLRAARVLHALVHAARSLAGRGDLAVVTRRGLRWSLDLREGIDLSIYLFGRFEPETSAACEKLVSSGSIVLDVGANVGAHALPLGRLVAPHGRVIAFEPTAWALAKLRASLALNPELEGVVSCEQLMLVSSPGAALAPSLHSSWPVAPVGEIHPLHAGALRDTTGARALTLDLWLETSGLSRVDLIKLDVDGHEVEVLSGGSGLLARHRPAILMELMPHGLEEHGTSLDELLALLRRHGYALFDLAGRRLPEGEALRRLIPRGGGFNVLATPAPPP